MLSQFPEFDSAAHQWTNIADEHGRILREQAHKVVVERFLGQDVEEVLVEVHRKVGTLVPTTELIDYLDLHMGEGNIRIANRQFTTFAMVSTTGVAAGWQNS